MEFALIYTAIQMYLLRTQFFCVKCWILINLNNHSYFDHDSQGITLYFYTKRPQVIDIICNLYDDNHGVIVIDISLNGYQVVVIHAPWK